MAEVIGKMITCDRPGCESQVFLKKLESKYLDGGFTEVKNYTSLPDGWEWEQGYGMLCPECHKEYTEMMREFNRGGK